MSTLALLARPGAGALDAPAPSLRARRLVQRNFFIYRRTPLIILTGIVEPFLYLGSIGVGVGHYVGSIEGVSYSRFVAPGLLAGAAMSGAVLDSTFNIYFKLKLARTYDAILSTPLGVRDVAIGEVTWALLRGAFYAALFLVAMAATGLVTSAWALLALPVAVLIGFAFAAVGLAATSYMRSFQDFDLVQLVVLPLFLFSTSFYPITTYPGWLRVIVRCTPLYHGVALERSVILGTVGWGSLGHVAYLAVMGLVGIAVGTRRLGALLLR